MAEHLIVVQAVEGSSPFIHPARSSFQRPQFADVFRPQSMLPKKTQDNGITSCPQLGM